MDELELICDCQWLVADVLINLEYAGFEPSDANAEKVLAWSGALHRDFAHGLLDALREAGDGFIAKMIESLDEDGLLEPAEELKV